MVVAVWSVKGGVGVSSIAALLAIGQVERAQDTLLVDLCGDVPELLGADHESGPGLVDWCALDHPSADALGRLEVEARPGLRYLPRGEGDFGEDAATLVATLSTQARRVIVDCGVVRQSTGFGATVIASAEQSLLVMRSCYLNLRRAQQSTLVPSGVIMVKEPHRALGRADVEVVTNAPVVAQVAFDPSIAKSIDAGLVRSRLPRQLVRTMGNVLRDES